MATEGNSDLLQQPVRVRLSHNILSTVNAVQGDTAREFRFIIDDYDVPEDAEIRIYIQKPSGKEIYHYCYLNNGEIVVQPSMQMLAEVGKNIGQIQIINNHAILTTFIFYLMVEENIIYSISITSMDEYLILSDLIDNARIEISQMQTLSETVQAQESARVAEEEARVQAEADRVEAENNREEITAAAIANVNTLIETVEAQEASRVTSEEERVQAEINRQTSTSTAIENCNIATDRANTIAEKLEDAVAGVINDNLISSTTTYSSDNIEDKLNTINNEISEIVNDDIISSNSTYSSNKLENQFEDFQNKLSEIINDESTSVTTTYSSNNIESKLSDITVLINTLIQINSTEPTDQPIGGIWFIEDDE